MVLCRGVAVAGELPIDKVFRHADVVRLAGAGAAREERACPFALVDVDGSRVAVLHLEVVAVEQVTVVVPVLRNVCVIVVRQSHRAVVRFTE